MRKDLFIIVGAIALLFVGWLTTGGPERAKQTGSDQDKFIEPLSPIEPTGTYDEPVWDSSRGAWQNPTLRN